MRWACRRWVHFESEHVDAEIAEKVEGAVELRLIEQRAAQHGARRNGYLLDPYKTFTEALVQPSLDPNAEAAGAQMAVVLSVLHVMQCRVGRGGMSSPRW